jgi:hypothetical protein
MCGQSLDAPPTLWLVLRAVQRRRGICKSWPDRPLLAEEDMDLYFSAEPRQGGCVVCGLSLFRITWSGVQWTRPFCMKRIRESAETGYTMAIGDIRVLLRRDACLVNATPVCRLYREIGLQFCNKLSERRVKAQLRKNRSPPTEAKRI